MENEIKKCTICGNKLIRPYFYSVDEYSYYRVCIFPNCDSLNYKEIPKHIPKSQHKLFIKSLNKRR